MRSLNFLVIGVGVSSATTTGHSHGADSGHHHEHKNHVDHHQEHHHTGHHDEFFDDDFHEHFPEDFEYDEHHGYHSEDDIHEHGHHHGDHHNVHDYHHIEHDAHGHHTEHHDIHDHHYGHEGHEHDHHHHDESHHHEPHYFDPHSADYNPIAYRDWHHHKHYHTDLGVNSHGDHDESVALFEAPMPTGYNIPKLTGANFETERAKGCWMINYYTPHCKGCRDFEPMFRDLFAEYVPDEDRSFHMAHVDCSKERDLCIRENVWGTPTIRIYYDGHFAEEYQGTHDHDALHKFAQSNFDFYENYKKVYDVPEMGHLKKVIERATHHEFHNHAGKVEHLTVAEYHERTHYGPWVVEIHDNENKHQEEVITNLAHALKDHCNVATVSATKADFPDIKEFPVINFIRNGQVMLSYTGVLPEAGITDLAHTVGDFEIPFVNAAQVHDMTKWYPTFALMLFDEHTSESAVRAYTKAAEKTYAHVEAFASWSPEIMPSVPRPAVLLYRRGDPRSPLMYEHDPESAFDITYFIDHNRYGMVQHITPFNFHEITSESDIMAIGLVDPWQHEAEITRLEKLGRELRLRYMDFYEMTLSHEELEHEIPEVDPEILRVRVAYMDSNLWSHTIKEMFNLKDEDLKHPKVVFMKKDQFYDVDETDKPFKFEATSLLIRLTNLWSEMHEGKPSNLKPKGMYGKDLEEHPGFFHTLYILGHFAVILAFLGILAGGLFKYYTEKSGKSSHVTYGRLVSAAKFQ